jgi:hypothetical protein
MQPGLTRAVPMSIIGFLLGADTLASRTAKYGPVMGRGDRHHRRNGL